MLHKLQSSDKVLLQQLNSSIAHKEDYKVSLETELRQLNSELETLRLRRIQTTTRINKETQDD